jgi:hypothetical protein
VSYQKLAENYMPTPQLDNLQRHRNPNKEVEIPSIFHTKTCIPLEEPIWPRFSSQYYREAQVPKYGLAPRQSVDKG